MSYCRWSSDDYQCDLYVYEGLEGWMIHVAGVRRVLAQAPPEQVPLTEPTTSAGIERFIDRQRRVQAILDRSEIVPIGLPHDGQTLIADSPGECADLLSELAAEGYRLPIGVIDDLRAEQSDMNSATQSEARRPPTIATARVAHAEAVRAPPAPVIATPTPVPSASLRVSRGVTTP